MNIKNSVHLVTGTALIVSFSSVPYVANAAEKVEFKWSGQVSRAMT